MTASSNDWAIGIDLGGTNVRAAAIDHSGALLDVIAAPIERDFGPPFAQLAELVSTLVDGNEQPPTGIGIGATGPVYPAEGVIDNPFTLPPNYQGNVREALHDRFALPIMLENDANAAALGETWQGAGRGAKSLVCLIVGTGIGVAAVHDGVLHRGADGVHPEAGHHVVQLSGPACYCGSRGCIESLASGTALVTLARARGAEVETTADVFAGASNGDLACRQTVIDAREAIAIAARNLVAVHAADVVMVSGGALGDPAAVRDDVQKAIDAFAFLPPGGTVVRLAELEQLSGCYGAAFLALSASVSVEDQ